MDQSPNDERSPSRASNRYFPYPTNKPEGIRSPKPQVPPKPIEWMFNNPADNLEQRFTPPPISSFQIPQNPLRDPRILGIEYHLRSERTTPANTPKPDCGKGRMLNDFANPSSKPSRSRPPGYEPPAIGATHTERPQEPKELRINVPPEFDGNREKFDHFINKCKLYLEINEGVYDTDKKMISYILGLMTKGEAHVWSSQYIKARTRAGRLYFDTYAVFMQLLEEAFITQDAPREALQQLKKLHMDKKHTEDHNAEFKTLVERSTLTDPIAIGDLYRDSLSDKVLGLIINSRNIPKNINDWYKQAVEVDVNN
ncbi:unnamed protein product [Cyclocybe aegerita]|uniref:DUF4939 domain-containing protein n=1 Tax=Cyclocybe aegerita TaxID=1973307 RepID=A0A8S0X1W5_CYCAE|nr:unnamed protein product [Cyclocybe aegerita]